MNALRSCSILLAACLSGGAAHAAVDAHLTVDMHAEGGPGVRNVPPDKHYDVDATLGDTWMIVRNGAHTSFFDFDRRRHVEIDEATRTRVDFSLYDAAGFRVMEMANRQNLAKMMAAAKIPQEQARFDPVDVEHVLAIQDKPGSPLKVSADGGDTVFLYGTRVLARESTHATPVPPAQARMFAQLVRYTWGGHPQILAALAQANAIPTTLALTTVNGLTTTTTIQVASVRASKTGPVDIAAIAPRPETAAQTPVDHLLARGDAFTAADIAAARQRARDQIDAALADKRPLDAYLGVIELLLTTGEPPTLDAAQKAQMTADPSVAALGPLLAPHPDKADMQHAIEQLDALRSHARSQGYMLDLFIANDRASLGDRKSALDGLVAVLRAHPFMAGAYKDLGDNLLMSYDASNAWRCWDLGRRIAPGFANFKAVNQFEANLATQHPEYF